MHTCVIVSFRLGLSDGVSVVALRWAEILRNLGFEIVTVAGEGPVDRIVPGLEIGASSPPTHADVEAAFADADLVLVENLCSIPMNLPASRVVADVLAGRPAIMHHHDPPWQRERYSHITELPALDDAWRHVTINKMTEEQMRHRGIEAVTIYNAFDTLAEPGDRESMRAGLGVGPDDILITHPVRAVPRKNIPMAIRLTEELNGTYWLLGQAEENYGAQLDWLLASARCPVVQRRSLTIPDIYAAADAVVFPSLWEGFGNPPIESAIHRLPCIIGDYPVAAELAAHGFTWFAPYEVDQVAALIAEPDDEMLDRNRAIALEHFSVEAIGNDIKALLADSGWLPRG